MFYFCYQITVILYMCNFQKRFKRLRRLEDEESDDEGTGENATEDREAIANTLFDMSDNVSIIMKI